MPDDTDLKEIRESIRYLTEQVSNLSYHLGLLGGEHELAKGRDMKQITKDWYKNKIEEYLKNK